MPDDSGLEDGTGLPSLTQLRSFAEVARLASISRASDELRRSQSAVTQSIQRLEEDLGVTLFTRTSSGSYLTDAGQILFDRAEKCFSRITVAVSELLDKAADDARVAIIARRITRAQIVALTTVNEHGSFAQAARYVRTSVTSLQRSARSLETQLGRELFVNTAQGIKMNKAGAKLSAQLLLAVRELDWAAEEIKSQQGVLRGQILVGSLLLAGNPFIAVGLDRFISAHPEAQFKLLHGSYDELLAKLRAGSIDFLVGLLKNPPPVNDVTEEALASDPYTIVVRRAHPLAAKLRISLDDLRSYEWIAPRPTAQRRRTFENLFAKGALPPHNVETHSLLTIIVLLDGGDRISLLTRSELALDQRLGNQLAPLNYEVDERPAVIGVTTRKDWEPTQLQRMFLDFLRAQGDQLNGIGAKRRRSRSG